MKKSAFIVYLFFCLTSEAEHTGVPYVFHRGNETLVVSNMPKFTMSEPITNCFVYIDGEYIDPPYVVSASNLAVCINGYVIKDSEPWIRKLSIPTHVNTNGYITVPMDHGGGIFSITFSRRAGVTTENVGESVDSLCKMWVDDLKKGGVIKFYAGGHRNFGRGDGDGGALAFIELARKSTKGDEQARQTLIKEMGIENSLSKVRPDWIQRLANNTNLEIRATRILESKRLKEQKEKERREQQNPQDKR